MAACSSSVCWNTILVSVLGIVFATILGFIIGIARLSTNWIVAASATVYVEIVRNLPLLLQLFGWYFAVMMALPRATESRLLPFGAMLNRRGLYLPAPVSEPGMSWVWAALLLGVIASVVVASWARQRQQATGHLFPVLPVSLALVIGLPLLTFLVTGRPLSFDQPHPGRFNVEGGMAILPELAALLVGLTVYTAAFIAEIVRSGLAGVPRGQREAAAALGLSGGQSLRLVDHSAGDAHHHSAAHQPVPEPDQELLTGGGDRLSGSRLGVRRHGAQPDRASGGGDPHHHGRLSSR